MMDVIPETFKDLLDSRACAHLVTLNPDGAPQVTPVWFDHDGECLFVNSVRGTRKDRNMRRDPRVALSILDPDNDFRYLEIRGLVVDISEQGADEHIARLVEKYMDPGGAWEPAPDEIRVRYRIAPTHATFAEY